MHFSAVLVADGGGDDDGGALPLLHIQALSDRTTQTEREAAAMEEINRSGNAHNCIEWGTHFLPLLHQFL